MSDIFAPKGGWRIRIKDLSGGAEDGISEEIGGFPTIMQANEFCRRYVRDSVELCRWRNTHTPKGTLGPDGAVMPERVITKPPSAELKPDQTDQDSLPPYDLLDAILEGLVEGEQSVDQMVSAGYDRATVLRVWKMLDRAEYKRRQAPPGVKITQRAFGRDRRYPITNGFTNLIA